LLTLLSDHSHHQPGTVNGKISPQQSFKGTLTWILHTPPFPELLYIMSQSAPTNLHPTVWKPDYHQPDSLPVPTYQFCVDLP